jgi:2-polyprenyl-3-methyl-5-hydroxy-6-metoxy-1,4-benzoquinol methylase
MRICPVSNSSNWKTFYSSTSNRIMTGDQRIGEGWLQKVVCVESGVVANKFSFSKDELELLYGKEYELNTLGKEEHYFYTQQGAVPRSKVFFEWIVPFIQNDFNTLIEIGCGEGNLLERFTKQFPGKNVIGIDGSHKAAELARNKGLTVNQKLIVGNESVSQADVFLLVNVIEHIEDIPLLINNLKKSLNKNGRIIFCLPIQDYGGYDIFFAEHVWHFTAQQFECILKKNGLRIIHSDITHPINHGIGLYVCEKTEQNTSCNFENTDVILKNLAYWENVFNKVDTLFSSRNYPKIAIFGASEVATLFMTFTTLGDQNIVACIDDTKPIGTFKHGIPVYNSEWLQKNQIDLLLLAVNKKYHPVIQNKLQKFNLNIISL